MTGLAGLESRVIRPASTFVCEGRWVGMGKHVAEVVLEPLRARRRELPAGGQ